MSGQIIAVHDEADFLGEMIIALGRAGYNAIGFTDPVAALDALVVAGNADVLITRLHFGPEKLQGTALAKMAKSSRPGVKVIFTAPQRLDSQIGDLGIIIQSPVMISVLIKEVDRLLSPMPRQIETEALAKPGINY